MASLGQILQPLFQTCSRYRQVSHFRFSSEEPGVVFAKVGLGDVAKRTPLLKDQETLSDVFEGTTEVIIPAGLLVELKKYLDAEIRPFQGLILETEWFPLTDIKC